MSLSPASAASAAFFDVDGTLLPPPSLEWRWFTTLRHHGVIPTHNYLLWLANAVGLSFHGFAALRPANKMHLCNLPPSHHEVPPSLLFPRLAFFPAALDQLAWHAAANHFIVLISGTLAPLAHRVAVALTAHLAARNVRARIGVCATRLEKRNDRYTGRILGEAMCGPAKARAVHQIATDHHLDLRRCYAYADSSPALWMLAAVGRPAAVNPCGDLECTARLNDWPVLRWDSAAQRKTEATQVRSASHGESVASARLEC